jgi:hypothetical protein
VFRNAHAHGISDANFAYAKKNLQAYNEVENKAYSLAKEAYCNIVMLKTAETDSAAKNNHQISPNHHGKP